MKTYRIFYELNGVHSSMLTRHYTAAAAYLAVETLMVVPNAHAYGIEVES